MTRRGETTGAYLAAAVATVSGVGSLVLFGAFLSKTGLDLVDLKMPLPQALLWDAALCLLFFLQHSGMIRRPFRAWLGRAVPEHAHAALYSVASAAALVVLTVFWQPTGRIALTWAPPAQVVLRGLGLLALAGFAWAYASLRGFDGFGAGALISHYRRESPRQTPLAIRGPYRWVRHPFYFCVIVLLWTCPVMSLDRLVLNLLFTVWTIAGAKWEERDLTAVYGEAYRVYQRQVSMLFPMRWPSPARTGLPV